MSCHNCENNTCLDFQYTDCIYPSVTGLTCINGDNLSEILQNIDDTLCSIDHSNQQITVNMQCLSLNCTGEPAFQWKLSTSKIGGIKRVWSFQNYVNIVGSTMKITVYSNGIEVASTTDPYQSLSFPVDVVDNGIAIKIEYTTPPLGYYQGWIYVNNLTSLDIIYTVKLACIDKINNNQNLTTSLENILNILIQQICEIKNQL